jgi:vacuolar-type H+-ATPase subunit C/Vma6
MMMLLAPARQSHAYGFGRVGVLQEYLLTQADVDRMTSAGSARALAQVITELKISSQVDYHSNPHRFINNVERWLRHEVRSMVNEDERDLFDILWMKDDAALLAYLLKKNHGLTSALSAEPHVGATAYDPEDLRTLAEGGHAAGAPEDLRSFVRSVRGERSLTAQEIDTRVARFFAARQIELARRGGEGMRLYVAHHIDLQNIRTARRLRRDERPEDHLLQGGDISMSRFSSDPQKLSDLVRGSRLSPSLADSIQTAEDSVIVLERGLARAIAADLAHMRMRPLTIEPIFAFAAIAQSQLKLLRTILVGVSAGLSPSELKKLLPPFLSASPYAE